MQSAEVPLIYAGFWPRLGAMMADFVPFFVLLPLIVWLQKHYRLYEWYAIGPWALIDIAYFAWLVSRYGGTPGKLLLGLRIVRIDGSRLGFPRAMLRQTPELILWLLRAVALAMPLLTISDKDYLELAANQVTRLHWLQAAAPAWYKPINVLYFAWAYGELIVLLTNKKRRALHDFLAGSVVIKSRTHVA
jgi:uncharacterized RDD family membrane protein YckC